MTSLDDAAAISQDAQPSPGRIQSDARFLEQILQIRSQLNYEVRQRDVLASKLANEQVQAFQVVSERDELRRRLRELGAQLDKVTAEKDRLLHKLESSGNAAAEAQRQHEERAEKEKEARIEQLTRQVARRMLNQGMASGWAAWHLMWVAKVHAMGRLRKVANRLKWPALSGAFAHWNSRREASQRARQRMAHARSEGELQGEVAALREELHRARAEFEQRLQAAEEDKQMALRRLRTELSDSAGEQMAALAEKEKEERVELLRRQFVRRMKNREISGGWGAWKEMWEARTRALKWLHASSGRMRRPGVSAAFNAWTFHWHQARRQTALKQQSAKAAAQTAQMEREVQRAREEEQAERDRLVEEARAEAIGVRNSYGYYVGLLQEAQKLEELQRLRERAKADEVRLEEEQRRARAAVAEAVVAEAERERNVHAQWYSGVVEHAHKMQEKADALEEHRGRVAAERALIQARATQMTGLHPTLTRWSPAWSP